MTVDILNESGTTALATDVAARLTAGGITIGTVTNRSDVATSGIESPTAQHDLAQHLADALGATTYLREVPARPNITVVLGTTDSTPLVTAIDRFTGIPPGTCSSSAPPR
jgi:hypothetical protein